MEATELLPRSDGDKFLSVPYDERWECLKHVIISFYLGPYGKKGKCPTLNEVVTFMNDNYAFSAQSVRQSCIHQVVFANT